MSGSFTGFADERHFAQTFFHHPFKVSSQKTINQEDIERKTFNLAGLQTAALVVVNPALRHKVWRAINTDEIAEPNVFAAEAAVAALTYGDSWLEALRRKIFENKHE